MRQRLEVRELSLAVRLGCTAAERATPQEVRFSVEIGFGEPPAACRTDRLEDTICYARLCEKLAELVRGREFATVERLAAQARESLASELTQAAEVRLRVHKVRPPVDGLRGGVIFELEW